MLPLLPWLMLASAPLAQVKLVYEVGDTACPPRAKLVSAVTARLGYDPFVDSAIDTVEVEVARSGQSLDARVTRSTPGAAPGRRELSSPTTDCSELFLALELAVTIAVDPRAGLARPAPPAAVPPPSPAPAPSEPEAAAVPIRFHVGLGPAGSLGTGPTPTFGFALLAGLRRGAFELDLGGRVELPSRLSLSTGVIDTQALLGHLGACLAVSVLRACGFAELGALRVSSAGLIPPAQQTTVLADLGLRAAVHVHLADHLALRPFFDLAAALAHTTVVADGQVAWASSPVVGTVGVALLVTSGP